jgi:hypothetical protein
MASSRPDWTPSMRACPRELSRVDRVLDPQVIVALTGGRVKRPGGV